MDAAAARPAARGPAPPPRRAGILRGQLDRAAAARAPGRRRRPLAVRGHHPPGAGPARLRLEALPLRPPARPGAREKNGAFATACGRCRRAASSCSRTRPTCCCSRRCAPAGPSAVSRRRRRSAATTPSGCCSGR
jgi:hypothetical protein